MGWKVTHFKVFTHRERPRKPFKRHNLGIAIASAQTVNTANRPDIGEVHNPLNLTLDGVLTDAPTPRSWARKQVDRIVAALSRRQQAGQPGCTNYTSNRVVVFQVYGEVLSNQTIKMTGGGPELDDYSPTWGVPLSPINPINLTQASPAIGNWNLSILLPVLTTEYKYILWSNSTSVGAVFENDSIPSPPGSPPLNRKLVINPTCWENAQPQYFQESLGFVYGNTKGEVSFRVTTPGYENRYLYAQSNFRVGTELNTTFLATNTSRSQASWVVTDGLATASCRSFRNKASGKYLRRRSGSNNEVWVDDLNSTDASMTAEATFCFLAPGLNRSPGTRSLYAWNAPSRYIRHANALAIAQTSTEGNTGSFAADGTWVVGNAFI